MLGRVSTMNLDPVSGWVESVDVAMGDQSLAAVPLWSPLEPYVTVSPGDLVLLVRDGRRVLCMATLSAFE